MLPSLRELKERPGKTRRDNRHPVNCSIMDRLRDRSMKEAPVPKGAVISEPWSREEKDIVGGTEIFKM